LLNKSNSAKLPFPAAAVESVKADACVDSLMHQNKYLYNNARQDHRAISKLSLVRPAA
jgi:hypothetical protein